MVYNLLLGLLLTAAKPAPPPTVLEGFVRDSAGSPIENALVFARTERDQDRTLATRTDARGAFRLTVKRSSLVGVWAQAPGMALRKIAHVDLGRPLTLSLVPGKTLEGRVTDGTTASPIVGAKVWAMLDVAGSLAVPEEPEAGRAVAITDSKGRFRLTGLGPGLQTVSASARGYGRANMEKIGLDKRPELFLFPGASISGAVAGLDGKPASGVVVSVNRSGVPWDMRSERTDAQGRFEVLGLEPGDYDIVATLTGAAPAVLRAVTVRGTDDERVVLSLEPPVRLTGRLLSDPRHPVSGRVLVQDLGGGTTPVILGSVLASEAGSDGRFAIEGVPAGSLVLGAMPAGFAAKRIEVDVPSNRPSFDLGDVLVERGLAIRGVVRGPGGPIAAASLFAWGSNRSRSRATTETDGSFVLSSLDLGTYSVSVGTEGFASRTVKLDAGVQDADILLDVAGRVSGEVTDRSGRPIESFSVTARAVDDLVESQGDTPSKEFATTDGRFTLETVASGRWVLLVQAYGYASATVPAVAVKSGATTAVGRIRLGSGGTLKGTVTNPAGEAVPGATIAASGENGYSFQGGIGPPRTQSDASGQFEITGLPPGKVDVSATHPAYARAYAPEIDILADGGPAEVKLVLGQGGRIEGSARRRDGTPIAGARVRTMSGGTTGRLAPSDYYDNSMVATDGEGRFAIERVPAGRARVTLFVGSGMQMSGRQDIQVDVRDGETATCEFVLRDILVSGTVTRSSGPASGLRVATRSARGNSFASFGSPDYVAAPVDGPQRGMALTGDDGRYALLLDSAGPGQAWVETLDGGTRFATQRIDFPDSDAFTLDFTLSGAPVTGTTVDKQTGIAIPYVGLWARRKATEPQAMPGGGRSDASGRFQLELEPGDYLLAGWLEGYANAEMPLSVGAGGSADVRLEISKGGSISGRVVTADGAGAPSVGVVATASEGETEMETDSRPDGSFILSNLRESAYTVSAGSALAGFAVLTNVAPGTPPVTLTLQATGRARIVVLGADGAPVGGAFVTLERSNGAGLGRYLGAVSDAAGVLEVAVPYGLAELRVATREASALITLEIKDGETATGKVVLEKTE